MKKLGIGPKTYRSVEFLLGLRNRDVAKELEPFGFTKDKLDEGWGLLADATGARLAGIADAAPSQPGLLQRIDEFENTWFPVARNVLARHYPDVGRQLFVNLVQTQGQEVVITVLTFLSRLEDMARGEEPFGADGPAARQLLAERGLTEAREAEAHALMAEARDLKRTPADPPRTTEEQAAAESALWAWYLEWSAIARVAIKSRATLRKLGFFKRRTSGPDEEPIEVADLGEPSAPEADTAELDGQPEAPQLAETVTE